MIQRNQGFAWLCLLLGGTKLTHCCPSIMSFIVFLGLPTPTPMQQARSAHESHESIGGRAGTILYLQNHRLTDCHMSHTFEELMVSSTVSTKEGGSASRQFYPEKHGQRCHQPLGVLRIVH